MKYLSPRSDVGFKKLFGDANHKNLTKSFLNSILNLFGDQIIETVEFKETEQLPETDDGRKTFFDVYCTDKSGKKFIIEMQSKYQAHFIVRSQYYTSLSFYRQIHSPFKYEKLVPVIFIGILDHILDDSHNDIISQHILMNAKHHTISSSHQVYYIVELPKFKKSLEECSSDFDTWLFFMQKADQFEQIPTQLKHDENFQDAFLILERARWSEIELDKYLAEADQAGKEDRIEQGAQEKKAKEIAKNFLKLGFAVEQIAQGTGLSIDEIEELKNR